MLFEHTFTLVVDLPTDAKSIYRSSSIHMSRVDSVIVRKGNDSRKFLLDKDGSIRASFEFGGTQCRLAVKRVDRQDIVVTLSLPGSANSEIAAIRKRMRENAIKSGHRTDETIDKYLENQPWINEARQYLKPVPDSGWTAEKLLRDVCHRVAIEAGSNNSAEQLQKRVYAEVLRMVNWNIAIPRIAIFVDSEAPLKLDVRRHSGNELAKRIDYDPCDPYLNKSFNPSFDALAKLHPGMHMGFKYSLTPVVSIQTYHDLHTVSIFERLGEQHELICWLKPTVDYFHVYLADGSRWQPDYVIEDEAHLMMCVIGGESLMHQIANAWCAEAREVAMATGQKPWLCLNIPKEDFSVLKLRDLFSIRDEWIHSV